jgi:hypothetical protein
VARNSGESVKISFLDGTPDWRFAENTIGVAVQVSTLPGWRIDLLMRAQDMRQIIDLRVSPLTDVPVEGITRRALDRISLGAIVDTTKAALLESESAEFHMSPALRRSLTKALVQNPRPGRRGLPDRYYAAMAADYVSAVVNGSEGVPDLAARHHISVARMRNLLVVARTKGLLTAAPPGRVGGELTTRAIELLRTHQEIAETRVTNAPEERQKLP